MNSIDVNSRQYWDDRFGSDWEELGGNRQTRYFATIAIDMLPAWLKEEILRERYSICDAGCGEGDALGILHEAFPQSPLSGFDFSQTAIDKAREKFPKFTYFTADLTTFDARAMEPYDIVFCSNTLEHFAQPHDIWRRLSGLATKYLIVLVPYREQTQAPEHETVFEPRNIPLSIGGMTLVAGDVRWEPASDIYFEKQSLLLYAHEGYEHEPMLAAVTDAFSVDEDENLRLTARCNELAQQGRALEQSLSQLNNEYYEYKVSAARQVQEFTAQVDALTAQIDTLREQHERTSQQAIQLKAQAEKLDRDLHALQREKDERLQEKDDRLRERDVTIADLQGRYDNLYAYSGMRDSEMLLIKNSRTYRFAQGLARVVSVPVKFGRYVKDKTQALWHHMRAGDGRGFGRELASPFVRVWNAVAQTWRRRRARGELGRALEGKRVIILPPTIDWHMPLFQRPQQLAKAYARKPDTVVLYLTPNDRFDHVAYREQVESSIWLIAEPCFAGMLDEVRAAREVVLSISWTRNKHYLDLVQPDFFIYEYIDELEIFHGYCSEMVEDHLRFLEMADVTVCTASKLYDKVRHIAKNAILSTNGGDYEFFSHTAGAPVDPLIRDEAGDYDCVLGYYGAVASWFDYELVAEVARRQPHWLWVIVGPDYDNTLGSSGIRDIPNVRYIPPQHYSKLPGFLTAFDIATIPFVINDITLSTSPVKLFEYMAAGKPILTSAMPECCKYESVGIYKDADDFIERAQALLTLAPDDPYWQQLEHDALANTWDAKTDEILSALPV